jgi:hypothetical protein
VGNFSTESSVVHQQNIKITNVSDNEFSKAVGKMESSFLIVTITDLWHGFVASESSSHSVIDTCNKIGLVPLGLLQLAASLPPYKSDWNLVNLAVLLCSIFFLKRGVDLTIFIYFVILYFFN